MKTPNLFAVPKDSPTRKERIAAFKKEHGIWTHHAPHEFARWSALSVRLSLTALDGYDLEDSEKEDPFELIANYCRLLDEWRLLVTGTSEIEAIRTLCAANKIFCPL